MAIELLRAFFLDGEDKLPRLKDWVWQTWALNELANTYSMSGQSRRAVSLLETSIGLDEKHDDKRNLAIDLGNAAYDQLKIGALSPAEHNLRRQIDLCREIEDERWETIGRTHLGSVLLYCGKWQESEQELIDGQKIFDKYGLSKTNYVSVVRAYRAQLFIFMGRLDEALKFANESLALANANKGEYALGRDIIRAHWLLGAAYRMNNELALAEENLSKALNLCRQINAVDEEAEILLDMARLRYAQGDFNDAQEKASEALVITERSGYVLQGADVHLFLAELALAGYRLEGLKVESDKEAAKFHAKSALKLAYCDGGEYKYKVAYEEAERMLERLK